MSTSVSVPSWPGVHRIKNLMANNSSSAEVDRSLIVRDTCVGSESPTWIRRLATTTRDHKFGKIRFVWSFQGTEYLYSTGTVLAGTLFWESRLSDSHIAYRKTRRCSGSWPWLATHVQHVADWEVWPDRVSREEVEKGLVVRLNWSPEVEDSYVSILCNVSLSSVKWPRRASENGTASRRQEYPTRHRSLQ